MFRLPSDDPTAWSSPPRPGLARLTLGRAPDVGGTDLWVTADVAYGKDGGLRAWFEQRRISYVIAGPKSQAFADDAGRFRADVLTEDASAQAWKRRSCGNGSKGPPVYDWAATALPADGTEPPGGQGSCWSAAR